MPVLIKEIIFKVLLAGYVLSFFAATLTSGRSFLPPVGPRTYRRMKPSCWALCKFTRPHSTQNGKKIDTEEEALQYKCGNLQVLKILPLGYSLIVFLSFIAVCRPGCPSGSRCIKPVCSCSKLKLPSMTLPYDRHQTRIRVSSADILSSMILIGCFLFIVAVCRPGCPSGSRCIKPGVCSCSKSDNDCNAGGRRSEIDYDGMGLMLKGKGKYQVKAQYLLMLDIVDTSIYHPFSGQSTTV